jgi:hypothetical protein
VQVISLNGDFNGFQQSFSKAVKSIVCINWGKLKKENEDYKIYGIAHEIAHHFAGEGKSKLLEKEANGWLRKWTDLDDIIDEVENDENGGHEKWPQKFEQPVKWKICYQ